MESAERRKKKSAIKSEKQFGPMKVARPLTVISIGLVALLVAIVPQLSGLSAGGRATLFILICATGLWITEAIPAFATSLLLIGALVAVLGKPEGTFASADYDWEMFLATWGNPLIWLFFGGFCLAAAAEKTKLDQWLAHSTLKMCGDRPAFILLGVMSITALLSMFISNTATATLMLAVLGPIISRKDVPERIAQGLLLGVALAANIGGMGTIIGTPPNAIASGILAANGFEISFFKWMMFGVPVAVFMVAIVWCGLTWYFLRDASQPTANLRPRLDDDPATDVISWHQSAVMLVFAFTVILWMTGSATGLPSTVVSLIPICAFTSLGILSAVDIRKLPWDILILIAGGLALGVAMEKTGLASWLVDQIPVGRMNGVILLVGFCYVAVALANVMSHTAAANVLMPLAIAIFAANGSAMLVAIALSTSLAMCLPISTPPNAVVFSAGRVNLRHMFVTGVLAGSIGPLLVISWAYTMA